MEEDFINYYDTFKNGLNVTNRGKGRNNSDKFNTFGFKFNEVSRNKMSESAKARTNRPTGYKHKDSTKQKWSELRKGKNWGPSKVNKDEIISEWHSFIPCQKELDFLISTSENFDGKKKFKNGREYSFTRGKLVLFKKIKSIEYGVTTEAIKRIITDAQLL